MLYSTFESNLKNKPSGFLVMYLLDYSPILDAMIIGNTIDFELLFDMGEFAVLTKFGYVNSNEEVIEPPQPYDMVYEVNMLEIENGVLFYKEQNQN